MLRLTPAAVTGMTHEEIDPKTWRRIYVATVAYGVLTVAGLWWFTSVFG